MSTKKDIEFYMYQLGREGWEISTTGKGHWKATHIASGAVVTASKTPSCSFALKHIKGDVHRVLRRYEESLPPSERKQKEEVANWVSPEVKAKLQAAMQKPVEEKKQPVTHLVESWKPRKDEEEETEMEQPITRNQKKGDYKIFEKARNLFGMSEGDFTEKLGYGRSASYHWKNRENAIPEVVENLCSAYLKIDELEKQLDDATKPMEQKDPIEFIKQGLQILNSSIKSKGLEAFIKPDGTIGARVVTTVEL